jgi:predicted ATPase
VELKWPLDRFKDLVEQVFQYHTSKISMKVQSVQLKYFKRFRDPPIFDFTDPETGLAKDLIVLVGMNGAGKTSILQAIAATLGEATGRLQRLSDLEWAGFNYELLGKNWGRFAPEVAVQIQFSSPEIQSVQEFQQKLRNKGRDLFPPANRNVVTLRWQDDRVKANSASELFQFKGREYAKQLLQSEGLQAFHRVGTTLWYTEQRTSTSLTTEDQQRKLEITNDILRDRLSKWRQFHQDVTSGKIQQLRPGQKDLYAEIEQIYKTVFPERSFEGPVLREEIDDILSEPWFYLYDGRNQYEISEMSGGERAIFPMLMDFASWNIHNSVILIDEIELHLHPPMQQALLRALPKLGKNNQFIITTHSDYVEQLVPEVSVVRLEV